MLWYTDFDQIKIKMKYCMCKTQHLCDIQVLHFNKNVKSQTGQRSDSHAWGVHVALDHRVDAP